MGVAEKPNEYGRSYHRELARTQGLVSPRVRMALTHELKTARKRTAPDMLPDTKIQMR